VAGSPGIAEPESPSIGCRRAEPRRRSSMGVAPPGRQCAWFRFFFLISSPHRPLVYNLVCACWWRCRGCSLVVGVARVGHWSGYGWCGSRGYIQRTGSQCLLHQGVLGSHGVLSSQSLLSSHSHPRHHSSLAALGCCSLRAVLGNT
jgi:hypothetical protein